MKTIYLFLPTLQQGGVQELAYNLTVGFMSKDIKVIIICLSKEGVYYDRFLDIGVDVVYPKNSIGYVSLFTSVLFCPKKSNFLFLPSYHSVIIAFILVLRPDFSKYYIFDRKLSNYRNRGILPRLYYGSLKLLSYLSSAYIFSYKGAENDFLSLKLFRNIKTQVIYHPVSKKFFADRIKPKIQYDLIFVGRLEPEKGAEVLIDALAILTESFQLTPAVAIVGDGGLKRKLKNKVRESKLSNVNFIDYTKEVDSLMSSSRRLVLPSLSEGCSGVVKEAIVLDLPCIVTNVDTEGPQEMIGNGEFGEICEPGNALDLAMKIQLSLSKDYNFEYAKQFKGSLSIEHAITNYIKVIFNE